jgi:anion-transporting  ArsA/GET3 family ATPase
LDAIGQIGISIDSLFVNRVLLQATKSQECARCRRERNWQLVTLQELRKRYGQYKTYLAPEFSGEIAGARALKRFTSKLWQLAE